MITWWCTWLGIRLCGNGYWSAVYHIPNIYQISTKSSTMEDLEEYIRTLIPVPRSVLCDYSSQSTIGYISSSWLVSTQPRIEYMYSIHLCLLYLFTYLIQLRYKAPVGVVILGHLGRSVRVTESDSIYIVITDRH